MAPPFLRPGVPDEEVKALFKRPGSVIKALSSTFCMCVHVCTKSQSNRYTCDDIPCIVYIHREGTRLPEGRLLPQTDNWQATRIPPEGAQVGTADTEEGPRPRPCAYNIPYSCRIVGHRESFASYAHTIYVYRRCSLTHRDAPQVCSLIRQRGSLAPGGQPPDTLRRQHKKLTEVQPIAAT